MTKSIKLLEQVHDQIKLRHYSRRTEDSYIHRIKDYMFHFYPKINIPLAHIEGGFVDFKLKVDEHQKWNWPQNLIYGLVFRIYYENGEWEEN
ncbi:MAG: hypothetical protein IMY71_02895 [Bacteroidetes bacterium]|nr:hypothetical protein [Bacteroidota bacterium]